MLLLLLLLFVCSWRCDPGIKYLSSSCLSSSNHHPLRLSYNNLTSSQSAPPRLSPTFVSCNIFRTSPIWHLIVPGRSYFIDMIDHPWLLALHLSLSLDILVCLPYLPTYYMLECVIACIFSLTYTLSLLPIIYHSKFYSFNSSYNISLFIFLCYRKPWCISS